MEIIPVKLDRDQLTEKLGGGIPKGSIILIEGEDGAGKSIMSQRFTFGFLENKASCTYISNELSTIGFVNQMLSLDYNIRDYIINEDLLFIPMFPTIGRVKLRQNFIDRMLKTRKIFEKDIIIFDTLSYLVIQEDFSREKIFSIVKFFKRLASMGKIIIISVDPNLISKEFLNMTRSLADIYMKVEARTILGQILRVASISRFRGPESEISVEFPFSVRPGSGLTIEIASLA